MSCPLKYLVTVTILAGLLLVGSATVAPAQTAVTAYYPAQPVVTYYPQRRGWLFPRTVYRPVVSYAVPAPVTTYYAPAATAVAAPVTTYYAPAAATSYYTPATSYYAPVTSYYAPTTSYYAPATSYYAPTTSYYAPAPTTSNCASAAGY